MGAARQRAVVPVELKSRNTTPWFQLTPGENLNRNKRVLPLLNISMSILVGLSSKKIEDDMMSPENSGRFEFS
jgi:hypothetical protein